MIEILMTELTKFIKNKHKISLNILKKVNKRRRNMMNKSITKHYIILLLTKMTHITRMIMPTTPVKGIR